MSDMMPSTRFCPKASSIISKRKNRNCSHSLKASSMRKSLAHKWKLGNKNFNDSLTSARAREALNQKIAVEGGKEDKALQRKREGKLPAGGDSLKETRPFQSRCHNRKRTASKNEGGYTMRLGEVMTRDVEVIGSTAPLKEAAAKMKDLDVGLIPVCEGGELKGTLTDRDITVRSTAEGRNPSKTKVSDIMSKEIAYCFEDQEIEEAMNLMEDRQIRRLPILNREKRLV